MKPLVVAGIGTDVGKTVVSAILCQLLAADYWKPVVSGVAAGAVDDEIVGSLLSQDTRSSQSTIFPTSYRLNEPLSPHIAARLDGVLIDLDSLIPPKTSRPLIIELAGGVLVPLDEQHTNLDLLTKWGFPVVVVSRHYLGNINHTLLTLGALKSRNIKVIGVVYVGNQLPDTEAIIGSLSNVPSLGTVPVLETVEANSIIRVAQSGCLDKQALCDALEE